MMNYEWHRQKHWKKPLASCPVMNKFALLLKNGFVLIMKESESLKMKIWSTEILTAYLISALAVLLAGTITVFYEIKIGAFSRDTNNA